MTSMTTDRRNGVNGGMAIKVPCRVATTANITLSGAQTIDGVACVAGDRILVKNQTTSSENGIYECDSSTWERTLDFDGTGDVVNGTLIFVHSGSSNSGWWYVTSSDPITIGTSNITIAQAGTALAVVSSFMQGMLNDDTAATARTTLLTGGTGATNVWTGINTFQNTTTFTNPVTVASMLIPYYSASSTNELTIGSGAGTATSTAYDNVTVGTAALAANTNGGYNTSVGGRANNALTSGSNNTCVGYRSGETNTTNSYNSYFGGYSGRYITGINNVAIGYAAMAGTAGTQTAYSNVAVGYNAYNAATSGTANVVVGASALSAGTSASGSVAIGASAMLVETTGLYNTAVGQSVFSAMNGGSYNTGIGNICGAGITNGTYNTFVGYNAGSNVTTGNYNTVIGRSATASSATVSNEITLGNSSVVTLRCQVTTITALSDARDKKDIHELSDGLDFVMTLKPVRFTWNMRDGGKVDVPDSGFIAQDLKASQEMFGSQDYLKLVYEENPDKLEAGYGRLLPVLVKAIQDQQKLIQQLTERVSMLEAM